MISEIGYRRIPVSSLKIAQYQHARLEMPRARKIAKEFDEAKFKALTVSFRDGTYWVVDGQHRLVAAKIKDLTDVMCEVVYGLTYEEEASLFATQDVNVKRVSVGVKYNAEIEAKDEKALEIKRIVESCGVTIGGNKANNQVSAIGAIKKAYTKYGEEKLKKTLLIIKAAWKGHPDSLGKDIIEGLVHFLHKYPEASETILVTHLSKTEPKIIIREGKADPAYKGGTGFIRYSKTILRYYNKGLRQQMTLPNRLD